MTHCFFLLCCYHVNIFYVSGTILGLTFLDSDTIVNFLFLFICRQRHLLSCCRLSIGECWPLDFFPFQHRLSREQYRALRSVSCHRCAELRIVLLSEVLKEVKSALVLFSAQIDSLKGAPVCMHFVVKKMCKLDLHLSFSEVVWDALLVLWLVRLESKLYSSGWHVLQI